MIHFISARYGFISKLRCSFRGNKNCRKKISTYHSSTNSGFTLIELLVVISVMAILGTIGFAAFSSYASHQSLVNSSQDIKLTIDSARFNAISQVKPSSCTDSLTGYAVIIDKASDAYSLNILCGGTNNPSLYNNESKTLPRGIVFDQTRTTCTKITFYTGAQAFPGPLCNIVLDEGRGGTSTLSLDANGNVTVQ